jgi:hypothetical protein
MAFCVSVFVFFLYQMESLQDLATAAAVNQKIALYARKLAADAVYR